MTKVFFYINDILDTNGHFINIRSLKEKYNCNFSIMEYNAIKDAIPVAWRKLLKDSHPVNTSSTIMIKLHDKEVSLPLVSNKEVYWKFVFRKIEPATATFKWEALYPHIEFDWPQIFTIPYIGIRETEMQSLQYKILNRFFPCNYALNKWYPLSQVASCDKCSEVDTLEHYFVECISLKYFWSSLFKWWNIATSTDIKLGVLDIIFGVQNPFQLVILDMMNFILLYAKLFIYKEKKNNKDCSFYTFQVNLKNRLDIEYLLCKEEGKESFFEKSWKEIYEKL